MKADVVIPFHGNTSLLFQCLRSLYFPSPLAGTVYLVDDGSTYQDALIARQFAASLPFSIQWISIPSKSGFVTAINHAWRKTSNEVVIVLNNDTIPPSCLLPRLITVLENYRGIAAVAPASDNKADLYQYRRPPYHHYNKSTLVNINHITAAPYLTAMCLAMRRSAITENYLFDPAYTPGYFEDLDLCCRLRACGWTLALDEGSLIHHRGRSTFSSEPGLHRLLARNYKVFSHRWSHLAEHQNLDLLLLRASAY